MIEKLARITVTLSRLYNSHLFPAIPASFSFQSSNLCFISTSPFSCESPGILFQPSHLPPLGLSETTGRIKSLPSPVGQTKYRSSTRPRHSISTSSTYRRHIVTPKLQHNRNNSANQLHRATTTFQHGSSTTRSSDALGSKPTHTPKPDHHPPNTTQTSRFDTAIRHPGVPRS
jgi:hypothetical protein